MREPAFAVLLALVCGLPLAARQSDPEHCSAAPRCRELTLAALARGEFERAHDFAWRTMQTSPKNDHEAMALVARAQSLSGRSDDAFVMLERLAASGYVLEDAEEHADFRRVREHPGWPRLRERLALARADAARAVPPPARSTSADPPAVAVTIAPSDPVAPADRVPEAVTAPAPAAERRGTPGDATGASAAATDTAAARAAPAEPRTAPAAMASATTTLALPAGVGMPVALVYDAVSARFVVADGDSGSLQVVSEATGAAATYVKSAWPAEARPTALAIDARRGDLWVATSQDGRDALHRLQLVSGRHLQSLQPSPEDGETHFVAVAVGPEDVYVLDASGRRIYVSGRDGRLRKQVVMPPDVRPTSLAYAPGALYVAHDTGILRVDLGSWTRRVLAVPAGVTLGGLRSLAYFNGALFGLRDGSDGLVAVRADVNGRGTAITSTAVLDRAAAPAAHVARGVLYFVFREADGSGAFRAVPLEQ